MNDSAERETLAAQFDQAPYVAPPRAPVLYVKPLTCLSQGGAPVPLPPGVEELQASATIALTFGRDTARAAEFEALENVASVRLVLDISIPTAGYFRPAVAERCRDGFLPVAAPASMLRELEQLEIVTEIDGIAVHRWSLARLVRPMGRLIADISAFMTLRAGDSLLIGLPSDAPRTSEGAAVRVTAGDLPPLSTWIERELVG